MARKLVIFGRLSNDSVSSITTRAGTTYGLGRVDALMNARELLRELRMAEFDAVLANENAIDHKFGELDDQVYASIKQMNTTRVIGWTRQIDNH